MNVTHPNTPIHPTYLSRTDTGAHIFVTFCISPLQVCICICISPVQVTVSPSHSVTCRRHAHCFLSLNSSSCHSIAFKLKCIVLQMHCIENALYWKCICNSPSFTGEQNWVSTCHSPGSLFTIATIARLFTIARCKYLLPANPKSHRTESPSQCLSFVQPSAQLCSLFIKKGQRG